MGTAQGWETRRRREKLREKEWEDAIELAAREDERSRIRGEFLAWLENACFADYAEEEFRFTLDSICPPDTPEPG